MKIKKVSKKEYPNTKKWDYNDEIEVSFKVKGDAKSEILELLQHCEKIGGWGHSFNIVIDPDLSEYKNEVYFDGDGADRLFDIKINGKKVTKDFLDIDKYK
jgi:hypothetical protein